MTVPHGCLRMLRVSRSTIDGAISRILADPRQESCGLLIGRRDGDCVVVDAFAFCANLARHPEIDFIVAPRDQQSIVEGLAESECIVGVFHSHLVQPIPSPGDLASMAIHDLVWLIIGPTATADPRALVCAAYLPAGGAQPVREIAIETA